MVHRLNIQLRSFVLGGNHGQYLQAAGLAQIVREICPSAYVTHARYESHREKELWIQARSLLLPKYLAMRQHWNQSIAFSKPEETPDVTIYGADQIWSHSNRLFPPDPFFFGSGDGAHKIAYAPSMGHVTQGFLFPDSIRSALQGFSAVAVRDRATQRAMTASGFPEPPIVVDPAFFLTGDWSKPAMLERQDLISVYCPQSRLSISSLLKSGAGRIANWPVERHGYLPRRDAWRLDTQLRRPNQVIERISRSRLLLTSTFHGVIMALMTGTPFVALRSDSLADRLDSPVGQDMFGAHRLITRVGLESLDRNGLEALLAPDDINCIGIASLVEQSRNWLTEAIQAAVWQTGKAFQ